MSTAKAYAASTANNPLSPITIQRRMPNDDDVVIAIKHCGVCHSDVSMAKNAWGFSMFPMVPGHEITGIVTSVGSSVSRFQPGDRVGVGCFVDSCTSCTTRNTDLEHLMPGLLQTYNSLEADGKAVTYGGYSESIVVKEGYVLKIPANLPLDATAPLLCAGITMYSPLRRFGAAPGKHIAIVGMGGLGHVGVKIAHAMGAEVTVLSQSLSKKEDSLRLGADHHHATSDAATFTQLAGSFDLIICTASIELDWNSYLSLLKIDGTLVIVGIPEQAIPVSALSLVVGRRSLTGSLMGSIKETQEMLDFCGTHGIVAEIERINIQNINQAFEQLERGDVRYRFVIDMASLTA